MRWSQIDGAVRYRRQRFPAHRRRPAAALVAGVVGSREDIVTPVEITGERPRNSVVTAADDFPIASVDELREDPDRVSGLVA